jgi:hypothetical protein
MNSRMPAAPLIVLVASFAGCRKQEPRVELAASVKPVVSAPAVPATSALPIASVAPSATSRAVARTPTLLDEAAKRKAASYLSSLYRGRKATIAKDFLQAELRFSECLKLVPGDGRALAERGYARLLAEKLVEAEEDLAAANRTAPEFKLLVQILHNRMLVARKRGDQRAAEGFERAAKELKEARRAGPDADCTSASAKSTLKPTRPKTMTEALHLVRAEHVRTSEIALENTTLGDAKVPAGATEATLWELATGGPPRDGGWMLTTKGPEGEDKGTHALISHAGGLYLYPGLAHGLVARCGYSPNCDVKIGGGVTAPWHLLVACEPNMAAYLCEYPDGSAAGCHLREDGTPIQSYCPVWSNERLVVLDQKTFEGVLEINASGEANVGNTSEVRRLLEPEFQAEDVVVRPCGQRQVVPYAAPGP